MSRKEFMERLEKLLWNISDSEREEALQYYNDYFDDAGTENEAQVIEELGSPDQVAQKIKAGLSETDSEFSEQGFQDARFRNPQEMISGNQASQEQTGQRMQENGRGSRKQPEINGWKIVAIVLLCILLAPIVIPVGVAVLAVVISVVIGLAAACLGIVVAGFAVLLSGLVVTGVGVAQIFVTPAVGIAMAGLGCLIFAVGILLTMATVWCCTKILPWLIRGVVGLVSYPFRKAGADK